MDAQHLLSACKDAGIDFFTGVPDSQLKGLCDTLYATYGVESKLGEGSTFWFEMPIVTSSDESLMEVVEILPDDDFKHADPPMV